MDFEKVGLFYLGRRVDPETRAVSATPLLYDAADLVTHAVIAGMTGSGKTGLGIGLIEEAALDGVPVIAIDPKGDLSNLLLTFPTLDGQAFAPWVNHDDARAAGLDPDAFGAREAARWAEGLAQWGQDGARIARLRAAADFAVYTPGSTVATPLSILSSLAPPPAAVAADVELAGERVSTAATAVLTLAGVDADPARSREHVLVSTLLAEAWRHGHALDLAALIAQVQAPTVSRIGALELEAFYPAADRFTLAMRLNNLLAAPGFQTWLTGEPLDVGRLLYGATGRPRVSIVSLAHLDDRERMFFVTLLLNEVVSWMRGERGTAGLRALIYFDEIMGYLPPVAVPPSKAPLLTLLKQARAYGVGLAVATQNPVDLDYKALSNAGTWLLGRLQTERDKARVLDGLETVGGAGLDRDALDRLLSSLDKREFLLHNVHDTAPVVFKTRWTMSYLRGPLGREELRKLGKQQVPRVPQVQQVQAGAVPQVRQVPRVQAGAVPQVHQVHQVQQVLRAPVLPPGIPQYFAPGTGGALVPSLIGAARVAYSDRKLRLDETSDVVVLTPISDGPVPVDWDLAEPAAFGIDDLESTAPQSAVQFAPLPGPAAMPRRYPQWEKAFKRWAAGSQTIELWHCARTRLVSRPGETERDFRIRLHGALREQRDAEIEKIRTRYASKLDTLTGRLRRAEQAVERESQQATDSKLQAGVSIAATIFGALLGRKAVSASSLGRATTAARGVSRAGRQAQDVGRARQTLEAVQRQHEALGAALEADIRAAGDAWDPDGAPLARLLVKPKRGGVTVMLVALVWVPR